MGVLDGVLGQKKDIRIKYVQNKGNLNTLWTSVNNNVLMLVY